MRSHEQCNQVRSHSRSGKLSPSDRRTKNFHHSLLIHNRSLLQPNRNIRKHRNLQTSSVLTQRSDPKVKASDQPLPSLSAHPANVCLQTSEQSRLKPLQSNNWLASHWIRCKSEKRVKSGKSDTWPSTWVCR